MAQIMSEVLGNLVRTPQSTTATSFPRLCEEVLKPTVLS
jgi:hypothetical protein